MVVCFWIFCAFLAALFFKEKVPKPRRNTLLPLPSVSFTHFMKHSRGIYVISGAFYLSIFICLPRGYPCVALYQRVVLFGKVIGLVLGSEIVIPEKVRMGRIPLALE